MKNIHAWFLLSLALTSALTGFTVFAADQSICHPGANVLLYDDGSLKGCPLKNDYDANNIKCKSNGPISFYSNGNLESCVLAKPTAIDTNKCKEDGLISFYIDGKLKSCVKPDN